MTHKTPLANWPQAISNRDPEQKMNEVNLRQVITEFKASLPAEEEARAAAMANFWDGYRAGRSDLHDATEDQIEAEQNRIYGLIWL